MTSTSVSTANGRPNKGSNVNLLETHNWLIHMYYTQKEFDTCKELINKELTNSHGMGLYPNLMQGIILRQEGKMQESLDFFQACQTYNPGHIENLKQIAKSWLLAGRHEAAFNTYIEVEKALEKKDWETCYNLGLCCYYMKQEPNAKRYFQEAIRLSNHSQSYLMLKNILQEENDLEGAIETFKQASEKSSENYLIDLSLGLLYTRAGKLLEAFEKLGSTLAHDPHSSAGLLAVGYIMQERNDINVALSKYRCASELVPESAALWNNIGMAFLKKQKFVAAVCCLKRANYLAPFDCKILYNLGLVHLIMQQYASAFHFLSAWLQESPYKSQVYTLLGVVLHHLDDLENAHSALEQASQLDKNDPLIPLNLAIFIALTTKNEESVTRNIRDFEERAKHLQNDGQFVEDEMFDMASQITAYLGIV